MLEVLPYEIWIHIFCYLTLEDLEYVSQVCSVFKELSRSQQTLKNFQVSNNYLTDNHVIKITKQCSRFSKFDIFRCLSVTGSFVYEPGFLKRFVDLTSLNIAHTLICDDIFRQILKVTKKLVTLLINDCANITN